MSIGSSLRSCRDKKLSDCDWMVLPDSPLTEEEKIAVILYRQALRDLPENTEDLNNPIWPLEPSCLEKKY